MISSEVPTVNTVWHCHAPDGYPEYPSIVHALAAAAEAKPNDTAIVCEDRELTYYQYAHAAGALARRFAELDAQGNRIAFLMLNSLEMAVGLHAGMSARAQVAPLNPFYTDRELEPIVRDVNPHILVSEQSFIDRARMIAQKCGIPHVIGVDTSGSWLDDLLASQASSLPLPVPDDHAALFFTGGSTGFPKGASHRHKNLMAFCYENAAIWSFPIGECRILNVAPLFHIWGFGHTLLFPVYIRAFMDLVPKYKPAVVLEEFQKRRITVFSGGPATIYMGLRANENFSKTDFSSLKFGLSGGAPCPEELLRSWEQDTGCVILESWGMSEGAPTALNPLRGRHKIRSVGIAPPHTLLEVVDIETGTTIMPTGKPGEIRARGPQFMEGYLNRPEENAKAFRDGWFYTGDIGYFDDEGYIFIVDRKKEMCVIGGYNVYPREIDELLFQHPAILEAVTVGVPDSFSGEAIKAYVVLRPGKTATEDDLIAYCRNSLVKYKVPTRFEYLDALPRTGVGKIDKLSLKRRG